MNGSDASDGDRDVKARVKEHDNGDADLAADLLDDLDKPSVFDLHFDLSAGVVGVGSNGPDLEAGVGFSFGAGGGVRIFLSRVLALTFDLQAISADRALSVNRDSKEAGGKTRFNMIFDVGLSFFMPPLVQSYPVPFDPSRQGRAIWGSPGTLSHCTL